MTFSKRNFQRETWQQADISVSPPEVDDAAPDYDFNKTDIWEAGDITQPVLPLLWLIVAAPLDNRGVILVVSQGQVLGRQGDIAWDDPRASRRHARFTLEADPDSADGTLRYFIWPLEGRNGTYVNGQLIRGATPLQENDTVTVGDTVFVVKTLLE